MKLRDKTLVVTGGASGIGRELVLEALRRGAAVAAVDMRKERLDALAESTGAVGRLSLHAVDITDRSAVAGLPERIVQVHGAVDGLINNAGIAQPFEHVDALAEEAIDRLFDVNFFGTLNMVRAFLPRLRERPEAHVANVASLAAFLPIPRQALYCASKSAVKGLTEGLYVELFETNVGVSLIMPGATATDIVQNSGVEVPPIKGEANAPRMTSASDAARIALDGIERNRLHVYTGFDSRAMNMVVRMAPKRAMHLVRRQMTEIMGA